MCVFEDDVCKFAKGNVSVYVDSRMLKGYTHFQQDENGRCEVAVDVNPKRFFDAFYSVF